MTLFICCSEARYKLRHVSLLLLVTSFWVVLPSAVVAQEMGLKQGTTSEPAPPPMPLVGSQDAMKVALQDSKAPNESSQKTGNGASTGVDEKAPLEGGVAGIGGEGGKATEMGKGHPLEVSPAQPVSFYIETAIGRADVMDERRSSEEKASWQKFRAKWGWTPKLHSDTGLTVVPADPPSDDIRDNLAAIRSLNLGPVFSQSLTLLVPIYTFGRLSAANDLADLGIEKEKIQTEAERREIEFQVRRSYAGLQLHAELLTILTDGQKLIKEALEEMEEARDFGDDSFSVNDYRELQIFDAEIDGRLLDLSKVKSLAEDGMAYFTKEAPPFSVLPFDAEPVLELPPLAEVLALSHEHRPQVLLLEKAMQAREAQRSLAIAEFFPNLVFLANMRYVVSTEDPSLQRVCEIASPGAPCSDHDTLRARPASNPLNLLSFGVAIGLRWQFDFPQQYGKLKEAEADLVTTEAQRRRALGAIELEIKKLWNEAQVARQKIEIETRRRRAAKQWRDQVGFVHSQAGGDMKKAISPLKAYFESSARYYQALFDYRVAYATLAKGVGITTFLLNAEH